MDAVNLNEPSERTYTIEDIYALPEGQRAELIDGQIYFMAPPGYTHQKLLGRLHQIIANYIEKKGGKCEALPAPFAVFLYEDDDKNYLEPDICVICDQEKIDEKGCHGAPDWIIEIVSPSSRQRDYIKKMLIYGTVGVREYWIVDPEKQIVTVFGFEKEVLEQYSFGEEIQIGIFDDLYIRV